MAWRVLTRRTFYPSHHMVELTDAGAAASNLDFDHNGLAFSPRGILVTVASDRNVRVTVSVGGRPRNGEEQGNGVIDVGDLGLEIGDPPSTGEEILNWPTGRTRVVVYGPPGNPYGREWITFALTPLDAPPPGTETEADKIDRLIARLGNRATQDAATESLRRVGPPAVPKLLALLRDTSASPEARYGAAYALGKIGTPDAVEALTEALADVHPHVRQGAADGFWELPKRRADEKAIAALVHVLSDHKERIAWMAAMALGKHGDVRVIPSLVAIVENGPEEIVDAALYALGEVGDASALPVIDNALARSSRGDYGVLPANVRLAAIRAKRAIEERERKRRHKLM